MTFSPIRQTWYSLPRRKAGRLISLSLIVTFVTSMVITPRVSYAGVMGLPQPGTMVNLSPSYVPLMITGLTIHPENPLLMDFIVSTGNSGLGATQVKKESDRLIKYFLACLTIPENNQWVNLSPYEKDRIIPQDLGQTVLGRDMLAQDYLLKQLTASLIYPEKDLGKNFWDNVYAKARLLYGTTEVPINTFNKVWILPDTAKVYEHKDTVFVVKSHLKVMLDEDYLALQKHTVAATSKPLNLLGANIVRQIILPAIEKEVNTGKNFAQMRQIYNSMILAVWFKKRLKQALLNQVYTDRSKVNGINVDDPSIKERIYQQYLQAYKKGVFNYIKEEIDQNSQEMIPRKYFSGGLTPVRNIAIATGDEVVAAFSDRPGKDFRVSGDVTDTTDQAMAVPNNSQLISLAETFRDAVKSTLKGQPKDGLSNLQSYLQAATGEEKGYFIGLDWGGTNVRVVLVHLQPGEVPAIIGEPVKAEFLKEYINGGKTREEFFKFLADKISELVNKNASHLEGMQNQKINLGFVFSFPAELKSAQSAFLERWTKGWNVPGVSKVDMGKKAPDIVQLLQKAIDENEDLKGKVEVNAILNDTVAAQLAASGMMGIILGTGHNISIRDPKTGEIINLEDGNFTGILSAIRTPFDNDLFNNEDPKGGQMFEKMISGKYLIQLLQRMLQSEIGNDKYKGLQKLLTLKNIDSKVLTIVSDPIQSLEKINSSLSETYGKEINLTSEEKRILKKTSELLLERAGKLLGAVIVGALDAIDPDNKLESPVIGIDGSLYNNPVLSIGLRTAINDITLKNRRHVKFGIVPSATAVGAAVAAAVSAEADKAMTGENLKTANTVTDEDFRHLVLLRQEGLAGIDKNVDTRRMVPAPEKAVFNWQLLPRDVKNELKNKEKEMFKEGKIAALDMVGGEATRFGGPKTFVEISDELGDFMAVKAANQEFINKLSGRSVPRYAMTSEKRRDEFLQGLKDRHYYGLGVDGIHPFVQGTVDTFILTDKEIEASFKDQKTIAQYKAFAAKQREQNPDGIYRFKGETRKVPAGHFDAIASFIISGQMTDALERGIKFISIENIDNLQAILKPDGMIAKFDEMGVDFGFILAEKNLFFTIKDMTGKLLVDKLIVRFRDNVISFDGIKEYSGEAEKDGLRFVINSQEKKVDVFDVNSGKKIETEYTVKAETGGTLVQPVDEEDSPVGEPIMKESFEFAQDFDHLNAPFFNTNSIVMRLDGVLRILGVSQEELKKMDWDQRSHLVREKLVKAIKANFELKNHEVEGEYPGLGIVKNGKTKIPVAQLTRIMLQSAHLPGVKVGYIFAPRAEVFAPVKEPEDLKIAAANNQKSLANYTDYGAIRDAAMNAALENAIKVGQLGLMGALKELYGEEDNKKRYSDFNAFLQAMIPKLHKSKGPLEANFPDNKNNLSSIIFPEASYSTNNIVRIKWGEIVYVAPHLKPEGLAVILKFFENQGKGLPKAGNTIEIVRIDAAMAAGRVARQMKGLPQAFLEQYAGGKTEENIRRINNRARKAAYNSWARKKPSNVQSVMPHRESNSNPAMVSVSKNGGIDLNSRNLNMQNEGEKVNITFDPLMIAQFRRGDFSGVKFQILNVVPVNLRLQLGL